MDAIFWIIGVALVFLLVLFLMRQAMIGTMWIIGVIAFIVLIPLLIPYWSYANMQSGLHWYVQNRGDNYSLWLDIKGMFRFYSRLLTWRRPFLT
ncbi:hypothetical protein Pmgp_03359 [Pelotomaculum propionicicum]|uniref:Uncharacterized protein n=1 Tax=Pelotomaculum propionicicum TaxID=258475 RepID=A0A4Y7RJH1_9FIRM|nr:hypothetical protein Pmgp_03359 [Pelotomaculum propionicicum]